MSNDKERSLFVLNKTGMLMTMDVKSGNDTVTLKIPKTWVPIDLSLQVRKADILDSPNYRNAIARNRLKEMSTEAALALLADDPDAKAEYNKVVGVVGDAENVVDIQAQEVVVTDKEASDEELKIVSIFEGSSEEEVLNELRIMATSEQLSKDLCLLVANRAAELKYQRVFEYVERHQKQTVSA